MKRLTSLLLVLLLLLMNPARVAAGEPEDLSVPEETVSFSVVPETAEPPETTEPAENPEPTESSAPTEVPEPEEPGTMTV